MFYFMDVLNLYIVNPIAKIKEIICKISLQSVIVNPSAPPFAVTTCTESLIDSFILRKYKIYFTSFSIHYAHHLSDNLQQ